ncbi:patatin-like phospholipase family protein [Amaricoccus sp.]|uniref:patatin-like phospholipase family protein n=1 Tax=Amaricoccus sp. TaxID=1872485 RepID=UPI001B5D0B0B|nr:patatin-like phospholipase family protein [Amaricoccus sp.]MBP7000890.1 patatin-like phospholipase family protein [Amaricoccus sp.]
MSAGRQGRKVVNLALQGGGAHGAFTWGALDRLLEEEQVEIEGITATSAGAMNAAALKSGYVAGGRDGARACLDKFWLKVAGLDGFLPEGVLDWLRAVAPSPAVTARILELSPAALAADAVTRVLSPYQFNPTNYHPMRSIVTGMMNYDAIARDAWPKLFICATNVRSGKIKVFSGPEIGPDAILASACLPTLYQAIQIPDPATGVVEAYWDGGYMGNPALFPLFYNTGTNDVVIVHINPIRRDELPDTATEILNRINEISFNASLLQELRVIEFVHRLIEAGKVDPTAMKDVRIHSVSDDALMRQLGVATKLTPNRGLLLQLKEAGRAAMDNFLREHWAAIGVESSVNLRAVFS